MIKLQIQGGAIIYSISPVQEIPSKNGGQPFYKRELILDDSWTSRDGQQIANYVLIEFTGDKMALLDNFQPGQRVTVDACVNGRVHDNRIFTSIRGLNITPYQEQPQQGYQQQGYAAAPASGYAPNSGYPRQEAYSPQSAYPQQQTYQQPPFPDTPNR